MKFNEKKEQLIEAIEKYILDNSNKQELIQLIEKLKYDNDFLHKELFQNIFKELTQYLDELSRKELKQRILMISNYDE